MPDLPGRLGDPDRSLATDPRIDPRMLATLASFGLDSNGEPPPVSADAPIEEVLSFVDAAEEGFTGLFGAIFANVAPVEGVTRETLTVKGGDDNEITLYIHRPTDGSGPLPGVYHIHGGGMVLLSAAGAEYVWWRDRMAATGLVVVGVEYRNGAGKLGPYPFPAGLSDCVAGLKYTLDNAADLGIGNLVVSGESGGGNLTIASTITANREGWSDRISGVYAECPYVSGAYAQQPEALTSLHENNGYFLRCDMMSILVRAYDPDGANLNNPLAWPLNATSEDLVGFPPTVISVNELDPLRDEGLHFLRKLWAANVAARGRVTPGTTHGGDILVAPAAAPEVNDATAEDIRAFCYSLR
ncbi:alpha/beta hydrolase fold domain-containing protein [Cumulibacter soli]|uniref:alpha/beta hydrolase fold domain-containing protein n=1 Tax=Cumulibacter soli TaxID=2546344 RepID=UPI001ABA83DA|nr:alpha/beta hydrolase fold domain-containing protein [Cumulibacter soli]